MWNHSARLSVLLLLLALPLTACDSGAKAPETLAIDKKDTPTTKADTKTDAVPKLCGNCGQLKGTADCCKADATACAGCQLTKGSPGCCKMKKGDDVALCVGCGQVKGGETCCKKGSPVCAKCKLHKSSPGCCKIAKN